MTNPNWGLLQQNGPQNALMQGLAMGQGIRARQEQRDYRNAMLQEREDARKAQQEAAQRSEAQGQAQVLRRLLKHAEQSPEGYAQALGAAQQLGIDVSTAPQQYDPEWVSQQRFIFEVLQDPQSKDQIDRDLARLGYTDPSQPGYNDAAREIILFKYAKPTTDQYGRAAITLPSVNAPQQPSIQNTPAPQVGANGMPTVLTQEQYAATAAELGEAETAAWAQRNGVKVISRTGTDKQGRRVVQYTDGTIEYATN